jgi:hypothetical protein
MSSESTMAIGEQFRLSRNALEKAANVHLSTLPELEWKKWAVIFIMLPDELRKNYGETRRLTRKDMTLDFRIAIEYELAKNARYLQFVDLMMSALSKTLSYFEKAGINFEMQDKIWRCIQIAADEVRAEHSAKH